MLTLTTILAVAQDTPEQMIKKFFEDYQTTEPDIAFDNLYKNMPWADQIKDNLNQVKMQFTDLQSLVGNYFGYELLTKKELANRFAIYNYLVLFDRQPIRFTFEFYKPKDKWHLYGFSYDDKIDDELEEATKLSNIDLDK